MWVLPTVYLEDVVLGLAVCIEGCTGFDLYQICLNMCKIGRKWHICGILISYGKESWAGQNFMLKFWKQWRQRNQSWEKQGASIFINLCNMHVVSELLTFHEQYVASKQSSFRYHCNFYVDKSVSRKSY